MQFLVLTLSAAFLLQEASAAAANAPWKSWKFCKSEESGKNNPCLVKAIKEVEKDLLKGNSYFGTPSIDPLHIDQLKIEEGSSNDKKSIAFNLTYTNGDITGLSSWQPKEAKIDWEKGEMFSLIQLTSPVDFVADYKVNGKVLLLPITGQGKAKHTFNDMEVHLTVKGHTIDKKNKKYFAVDTFDVELFPKKMTTDWENLFNGNKELGDNINKVMNENWELIFNEVKKPVGHLLGVVFKELAVRVFGKIPMDQLAPK